MENQIQTLETSTIEVAPGGAMMRYSFFEPKETVLRELIDELFLKHWSKIVFGPSYEGATFEIRFEAEPKLSYSDGYLTAHVGAWHFHLCLSPGKGSTSAEAGFKRAVAKAALFERRGDSGHGGLRSWGVRLWNGFDQQMITIWLPNPSLSDERKIVREANWSKLDLYYELRSRLFGEPIPANFEEAANRPWPEDAA